VAPLYRAVAENFERDGRTWVYAELLSPNSTEVRWVPLRGSWTLHMPRDWNVERHRMPDCPRDNPSHPACKYVWWDESNKHDFPTVVEPKELAGWLLLRITAWRPISGDEPGYYTGRVWLQNGTTLACYNITFLHKESGVAFWQLVAVSTVRWAGVKARYELSAYSAELGRRPIHMWIEAALEWKYRPPHMSSAEPPPRDLGVSLETPDGVVAFWAPKGTAVGASRRYVITLGDTEEFYRATYPRGLSRRTQIFRLAARWSGAGGEPTEPEPTLTPLEFTMAPASTYLTWPEGRPEDLIARWDCFESGETGKPLNHAYRADVTVDVGDAETHELLHTYTYRGRMPPLTIRVDPDLWVAFYPLPSSGVYEVRQGSIVPVPLTARYPPRAP